MKKYNAEVFKMENETWTELTDEVDVLIDAESEAEALSVAEDILLGKGYTTDELKELDIRITEKAD